MKILLISYNAENWAIIKHRRLGVSSKAYVTVYEIPDSLLNDTKYLTKVFENANEEWLDFIVSNRRENKPHLYDIVKGAVANDTLFQTLTLYETGILNRNETITRLKAHVLFDQLSFHNQKVLNNLTHLESYLVPEIACR